jgi:hypothetical protein
VAAWFGWTSSLPLEHAISTASSKCDTMLAIVLRPINTRLVGAPYRASLSFYVGRNLGFNQGRKQTVCIGHSPQRGAIQLPSFAELNGPNLRAAHLRTLA